MATEKVDAADPPLRRGDLPAADEAAARTAGHLLGKTASEETIDALVVATAIHAGGGRILTGDPDDVRRLARGAPGVTVHSI